MTTPLAGSLVDAIDATHHFHVAHLHVEVFFGVEDLGHGSAPECRQKILQLQNALRLVEVMLVVVLNAGGSQFIAKELDHVIVRHGRCGTDRVVEGEQHSMYDCAILHGGGNFARNFPLALQLEL